jgi:hypothetical protein
VLGHRILRAQIVAVWLLASTLCSGLNACGSDDSKSIDFGAGADPAQPAPRGRPYPCPESRPEHRAACSTRDLSCEYDDGTCTCTADVMGMFGALAWNCPADPAAKMCPTEQPEAESACTSLLGAADCSYGRHVACICGGETQAWACWDPADCPKNQPQDASSCDLLGMACRYGSASCECLARGWQCEAGR